MRSLTGKRVIAADRIKNEAVEVAPKSFQRKRGDISQSMDAEVFGIIVFHKEAGRTGWGFARKIKTLAQKHGRSVSLLK